MSSVPSKIYMENFTLAPHFECLRSIQEYRKDKGPHESLIDGTISPYLLYLFHCRFRNLGPSDDFLLFTITIVADLHTCIHELVDFVSFVVDLLISSPYSLLVFSILSRTTVSSFSEVPMKWCRQQSAGCSEAKWNYVCEHMHVCKLKLHSQERPWLPRNS